MHKIEEENAASWRCINMSLMDEAAKNQGNRKPMYATSYNIYLQYLHIPPCSDTI